MLSSYPSKPPWDERAWFLGLFLGNFAGLLLLCGGNPTSRRFLEAAFPYTALGYYTGDLLIVLGPVLGALIFPAVLTCVAKRSYASWGLLPLALLILWIIAGNIVSHSDSSLFDPPWALPLAAVSCWAVACGPISLFRFLRRHRSGPATSTLSTAPKKMPLQQVRLAASLTPLLALAILGWYNLRHPLHFQVDIKTAGLSDGPVRVPLVKRGSGLYVNAWLNGTEQLCKLDTGANSVDWPRGLHVRGRLSSRESQSCDVLGICIATQTIVLPHIRIGGYEIMNLPTEMSDNDPRLFAPPQRPDADDEPLLGNPAFVMTVLTVDCKNAVMIIRPPEYDFTRQSRRAGDRVVQMGWTTSTSDEGWGSALYGVPAVHMTLAGASFWCTLDTGAGGPELCLTDDFVRRHPSIRRAKHDLIPLNATYSSAQVERLHDLHVTIPCLGPPHVKPISLTLGGAVIPTLDGDDEGRGVTGRALMERYRITIDYQRRRVLLEPYARTVPGQKQEKASPKAKLRHI